PISRSPPGSGAPSARRTGRFLAVARILDLGNEGSLAQLFDDLVAVAGIHDALDRSVRMPGDDDELRRLRSNNLVLGDQDRDPDGALFAGAFADDLERRLRASLD